MAIKFILAFCRRIAVFAVFLHLVLGFHCPIGWDGYGNSCYKVVFQSVLLPGINWEKARRDCLDSGGDLVSIASQSEMSFVSNISLWNEHYWIGLNDRRNESQFVWSDGTSYNASVYSNWHLGEPNDRAGEDCVELYRTRWNDNGCKARFGYICEKPKGPSMHVTTVMPPVTSDCPSGWHGYGNSCYMFVIQSPSMQGVNWENARKDCLGYGGDLVSIASHSEMHFVYSKSSNVWTQHYWIGLNDRLNESLFVWSDNTPYNASVYSKWRLMEPNDQNGEDCVELYRTGWNDANCKKEFGYICEKPKENVLSVTICEQQQRIISCEGGAAITVLEASFGRHDGHTCPHPSILTTNCNAASSLSVVRGNCDDQASCTLFANNSVFGDPCFGTFKYLQVKYKCIGVPPRILSHVSPSSVICEKYKLCCLFCYATSDSPVTYSWTKNGQDPVNDDIKVVNSNIAITPRSAQDYGVYVCHASNSFGSTTYEITLTPDPKSSTKETTKGDDSLSNVYCIAVIALSCIVFVLLIAVGLLIWRLMRSLTNKRENTPEGGDSYEVEQHKTRDHHVSQGDGYLEPLEVIPPAISRYQTLHSNGASVNHGIVVSNSGTDNEDYEPYVTIIP